MANLTDDPKKPSLALNDSQKALEVTRKLWLNERLVMAELMKPGEPLDDLCRALTIKLWLKTLNEIGEERFEQAFEQTLETTSFRPDISEIRKNAGIPADPTAEEAKEELYELIKLLRHHGRKLTNRGKPEKEPPGPRADVTMETIRDMGIGSMAAGLEAIWAHPSLDLVRPPDELGEMESFRAVAGEKIEKRWVEGYRKQKIKLTKGGAL
jgi:hypothetical protein